MHGVLLCASVVVLQLWIQVGLGLLPQALAGRKFV